MSDTSRPRQDPLNTVQAETLQVAQFLHSLGATDGEYVYHVVQTLLERPQKPYRSGVALLVARALRDSVPPEVVRFAAAVQVVAVAGLTHRQTVADSTLVPAEQPAIDAHLVVLAGDYLYAQAAYITAGLQNLKVMAILAEEIKLQCQGEVARHNDHTAAGASAGLYSLSAVGTGYLLDCDPAQIAELQQYGNVLDTVDSAALSGVFHQVSTATLLQGIPAGEARSTLIDLVEAIARSTPVDGATSAEDGERLGG
ncbi:MAG: Polyprenyl synthetase [Chloroflexi bacterium]|nr:Polyprenyl synthetase [Chloroflexota bacterium]